MSKLNLSIDASQIAAADQKQQRVKVAVQQGTTIQSQMVAVEAARRRSRSMWTRSRPRRSRWVRRTRPMKTFFICRR